MVGRGSSIGVEGVGQQSPGRRQRLDHLTVHVVGVAEQPCRLLADLGEIATETTQAVVSQLIGGSVTKAEVTKALKASEGQEKSNG